MWSSKYITIAAVLCCLALPSCGFQPMYGDSGTSGAARASTKSLVEIGNIPDRNGQYLRNQLIDRLYLKGRPADAPYVLTLSPLKDNLTNLGIRRDATSTRGMLEIYATMTLTDRLTAKPVLTRQVRSVGSYNELDNQFATVVSEQALKDHMLEELADSITTELNLFFSRQGTIDPANVTPETVHITAPLPTLPATSPRIGSQ
ncbi:MAG: LPS assembly lipoprotein LptE [Micavibrio sp.]|nr:LPS assembly lipoprotein LptE [Micavibrio sp.]